jgi:hypothetical protein
MAKITPRKDKETIVMKTMEKSKKQPNQGYKWWLAKTKEERAFQMVATAEYLKEQQQYRMRQAAIYGRLYGNMPLYNFAGLNKANLNSSLPADRPTMNIVQSCVDTLVSRITQNKPRPVFLTDNGDYKERNLAKQLNQFIMGEFYQTKAYELGTLCLRDGSVLGDGVIKVYEDSANRVALERVLSTEILVDHNDGLYGAPRTKYQYKLVDRSVVLDMFPEKASKVGNANQAYPDAGGESSRTTSDQILLVEAWRLPSGKDAGDGMHIIACSAGELMEEEWKKEGFPFAKLPYSPRMLGYWAQGLAEQLMGTQVEINKILATISTSINLVGVPRVFVEDGSKVIKAHLNNSVGSIVTYQGTKPSYEVAPCVPVELYTQLERLIQFGYQQSGISALAATSQKPAGLNSGEAIRNYDDLQTDRFATTQKRYENFYVELAYLIIDKAKEIAERDGKYQTVFPNKNGIKEIDLPKAELLENPFVIQCFNASSLPREPAGRLATVTEMMQAGLISPDEGRRLLDYPDIEQDDKLATAKEERILQILDDIIDTGKYTPPDPFMDLELAELKVIQYYNLYSQAKLEEEKAQSLRDFFTQIQDLKAKAQQGMMAQQQLLTQAQAVPQAPPVSDLLPTTPAA